ncbi:hypothetical protein bcere0004_31170 [Bacillus cereus BGSC 6E1]|nr:hypothetical protein bcere0004_31170 [Bacillus cereus BGSC 6E1]
MVAYSQLLKGKFYPFANSLYMPKLRNSQKNRGRALERAF